MKKNYTLACGAFILLALGLVLSISACKKDKDNPEGYNTTGIQVKLPSGSSVDPGNTQVYALSKSYSVGSDGKANIGFNEGTYELACLFDNDDHLLLMGFISDESKEISVTTTAQALLYFGLGTTLSVDVNERVAELKQITSYKPFTAFVTTLSEKFVADPHALVNGAHLEALLKAVNDISNLPVIDIFAKQISVKDADVEKSGLNVRATAGNDESMEISNNCFRRSHAFLYKTGYKDASYASFTLLNEISGSVAPTKELDVLGRGKNQQPEISGPVALPLENYEKEATWKVRVIGVGGDIYGKATNTLPQLTTLENAKLNDLWEEFFAADLLLPFMMDALNQRSSTFADDVRHNNLELARPFINKTRELTAEFGTIGEIKKGLYREEVAHFLKQLAEKPYKWEDLATTLIACMKGKTGKYVQYEEDVKAEFEKVDDILTIISQATDPSAAANLANSSTNLTRLHDKFYDQKTIIHDNCNTLEEWTVTSKDNDVAITPKNSQTMEFTNHVLTASATADLANGESIEYEWSTSGVYGVFKVNGQEMTQVPASTSTSVTFYGKNTPNENNIQKVYVTAYVKGPNGTRELGRDTATVNVKDLKVTMKPNGEILSPRNGVSSIKLYLLKSDGTNPIISGDALERKVEWRTAGSYGHFAGNTTSLTTSGNSVTYIATDEDVESGTETITADIYFKLANTGWLLQETVTGTVKINNQYKTIIYYTAPQAFHNDRNGWHYAGCGVVVDKMPDAVSYGVAVTGIDSQLYPTYNDSWTVTGSEAHVRGYMGYVMPNDEDAGEGYITGVYGTFSWGSCSSCEHHVPTCTGTAKVTVLVQQ